MALKLKMRAFRIAVITVILPPLIYISIYNYLQSAEAQEVWMDVDIYDYITSKCEWAEVS